jgi:DNA repair exonuclease SbcCD ATPase subunit
MYDSIVGNKGMTARMLYAKLLAVEEYINKIMAFSKYNVRITMEDGRNEITVLVQNSGTGKWLSTHRLSGYEKLLLQIAFKRALNKYSYSTKCGLIILDEALDCIDQDNFQGKLPDIINMITKDYYSCLAISQRDITHICERQIIIRKHEGNSIID